MTRFLFAAAAASLTLASPALARDCSFTHEGITYTYTAAQQGEARILEGTTSESGKFKLTVKNGWVRGYVGNTAVSFRVPKSEAGITTIAAR